VVQDYRTIFETRVNTILCTMKTRKALATEQLAPLQRTSSVRNFGAWQHLYSSCLPSCASHVAVRVYHSELHSSFNGCTAHQQQVQLVQ
jgi:hypothetical protein